MTGLELNTDKKHICWDITSRCNDRCLFCYRSAENKELSLSENLSVFKNLADNGAVKISFTGGEPLLYGSLFELAAFGKEYCRRLRLSLITNGLLLARRDEEKACFIPDNDMIQKIAGHFDSVTFSLDAPCAETESSMSRNPEHFDRIMFLIDHIHMSYPELNIKINTLVSKINFQEIGGLFELLKKKHISRWKLFHFIPSRGCAAAHKEQFYIPEELFNEVCGELKKQSKPGMEVTFNTYQDFKDLYFNVSSDGFLVEYDGSSYKKTADLKTPLSSTRGLNISALPRPELLPVRP